MRRLNLDSIALPFVSPDQVEITDKASPRGAALTELGRILDDRVVDGDAAVVPPPPPPCSDVHGPARLRAWLGLGRGFAVILFSQLSM